MDQVSIATSLRTAVSSLSKRLRKHIYASNNFSITELMTLGNIDRYGPVLPSELAEQVKIKTQSMSQILKKLEEKQMIKRTQHKEDKRKVFITLSASGKKIVDKTRYERDEWLGEAIIQALTEKEIRQLPAIIEILEKIANAK